MANITSLLTLIKNAVYGKDMRQALHDAINTVNVDTESRLSRTGGTMTGPITMNANKITSSAVPSTNNDYTNKKYVDDRDALKEDASNKGTANGYASLDSGGKVPSAQLPDIAITDTFVVSNQTQQLALTAQVGDVAVRTDLSKSFILKTSPASTLSNWQELLTPPDSVLSVAGKTGAVTLTKADVGLGNSDNTSDSSKEVLSATKLKTPRKINGVNFDGTADITIIDSTKEPSIALGTEVQMWVGNKTWKSILTVVQGVLLTGLSTATNSAITATDTIIKALGKLQAQINGKLNLSGGTMTGPITMNANKITSSAVPSTNNDYTNKKYVDTSIEELHDILLSKLMDSTSVSQVIEDSIGDNLLDSNGEVILGRVTLIDMVAQANEAIERLNTHALLDSTF